MAGRCAVCCTGLPPHPDHACPTPTARFCFSTTTGTRSAMPAPAHAWAWVSTRQGSTCSPFPAMHAWRGSTCSDSWPAWRARRTRGAGGRSRPTTSSSARWRRRCWQNAWAGRARRWLPCWLASTSWSRARCCSGWRQRPTCRSSCSTPNTARRSRRGWITRCSSSRSRPRFPCWRARWPTARSCTATPVSGPGSCGSSGGWWSRSSGWRASACAARAPCRCRARTACCWRRRCRPINSTWTATSSMARCTRWASWMR